MVPPPGHPDREAPRIMVTPVQTGEPVKTGGLVVSPLFSMWRSSMILFLEHWRKGPPVEVGSPVIDKSFEISAIGSLFPPYPINLIRPAGSRSRPPQIYRCSRKSKLRRRIVYRDYSAVVYQLEVEHVAARYKYPGPAHEPNTEGESCSDKMERVFMQRPLRQIWLGN